MSSANPSKKYIVVGSGILGLFCAAMLALNGEEVLILRGSFKRASENNQGWLQSGVSACYQGNVTLRGAIQEVARATLNSHHWILDAMEGVKSRGKTGLLLLPADQASRFEGNVPLPQDNFIEKLTAYPAGELGARLQVAAPSSYNAYRVHDRPFPEGVMILNVLDHFLNAKKEQGQVKFSDEDITQEYWNAISNGSSNVLLCCGATTPSLIGIGHCKELEVKRTPLIATLDIPELRSNFLVDTGRNFAVVRHVLAGRTVLVWSREMGLSLDLVTLKPNRTADEREYSDKRAKFVSDVTGFVGQHGVVRLHECMRIQRRSNPSASWQVRVNSNVAAGLPGKATVADNAARLLLETAEISIRRPLKSSDMDKWYADYQSTHSGPPTYRYWFE